jgi:hypothetical protein
VATKKQKPAAEATVDLGPLVDELGQIEKDLAPHQAKIARVKTLKEAIRKQTPDDKSEVHGRRFVARLGARGNETVVDYPALAKKVGYEKYAAFATATLKALAQHLKPGVLAMFTHTEQTGPRSLEIQEKGQPA